MTVVRPRSEFGGGYAPLKHKWHHDCFLALSPYQYMGGEGADSLKSTDSLSSCIGHILKKKHWQGKVKDSE